MTVFATDLTGGREVVGDVLVEGCGLGRVVLGNESENRLGGPVLIPGFEVAGPLERSLQVPLSPAAGDRLKDVMAFIGAFQGVGCKSSRFGGVVFSP